MEAAAAATSSPSEPSEALVEQLSFYFTDANLRRDRFMKTFTGADGTGKMPVETLATFNRVKALTQDVGTIVAALRLIPGLQVSDQSDQGHTVQRTRTLPAKDDSEERTVYVEPLPPDASHESIKQLFSGCGGLSYISLPRLLPSRALKGFAFVEFDSAQAAAHAVHSPPAAAAGGAQLQVLSKRTWSAMQDKYKELLLEGKAEAEARSEALAAAVASEASRAAAQAEEDIKEAPLRSVVRVSGIGKGAQVKQLRREMAQVFGAAAPLDYVDYGVTVTGDTNVGYVRFRSAEGAAEAVRLLTSTGQELNGRAVTLEVLRGAPLREYLERSAAQRAKSAPNRHRKKNK